MLRTGGAALRTVTVLVDEVLRPALEAAGLPPGAVGLVRTPDREGARALVSLPKLVPLVILRGSGETTAALARLAAEHGVRTLAHAEGGGVLYVHRGGRPGEGAPRSSRDSLDRLGVCNRLNLLLVEDDRHLPALRAVARGARTSRSRTSSATSGRTTPTASRPSRSTSSTRSTRRCGSRTSETSGLAAGIVTEDEAAAKRFLDRYRGTAAFWHATTRFTDGSALTGAPETGINVDWTPGPRGPVTYRDLWLRQYRVVGDATQRR